MEFVRSKAGLAQDAAERSNCDFPVTRHDRSANATVRQLLGEFDMTAALVHLRESRGSELAYDPCGTREA